MPAPVQINFAVGGIRDVQSAFRSVEQSLVRLERSDTTSVKRATSTREKEYAKVAKTAERWTREAIRDAEKAEREKTRAVERGTKEQLSAQQKAQRVIAQGLRDGVRDFEKAEREKTRLAEQHARQRERFASAMGRGINSGTRNAMHGVSGLASATLGIFGGFAVDDSVRNAAKNRGTAADIANAGYDPNSGNAFNRTKQSSASINAVASSVATREGMETGDVLGGLGKFVGLTGDLDMGMKSLSKIGELATATGSNFEDLASAAAEVFNSDTKQSMEDMMLTLRAIAGQGKIGAVEIKDMATQAAKVTASAGKFEGNKADNVVTLSAMAQEAKLRGGAANATEAMTSVARFSDDVAGHRDKFAALGIATKSGGVLRGPEALIKDTLKATKGDVSAITGLFGVRSARSVQGFAEVYRNAGGGSSDPKKQADAMKAVEDEFKRLKDAMLTEEQVAAAASARRAEADVQFASAMNELKDAVGGQLLPVFLEMVPALRDAIPKIKEIAEAAGHLIEWFLGNPFEGLGSIVALSIGEQIAAAKIGEMIGSAIGIGGIAVVAATIAIEQAIIQAVEAKEKRQLEGVGAEGAAGNEQRKLEEKIKNGTATQKDIDEARKVSGQVGQTLAKERDGLDGNRRGNVENFLRGVAVTVDPNTVKVDEKHQRETLNATATALRQLNRAIAESEKALKDHPPGGKGARDLPLTNPQRGGAAQ